MPYTAVVLDKASQSSLLAKFADKIPDHWEKIAHHFTISMGKPEDGPASGMVGMTVLMKVVSFAQDNKVMAVGIETNCPSNNKIKHITLAVNRLAGGKPAQSNNLTNWESVEPFELSGVVMEQ